MAKFFKIIEYLFYAFLFLLPWQTCWIWRQGYLGDWASPYLTFSLYGTEILLGLIFVLAVIYKILNRDWEISFLNFKVLDFYLLFLLLLILAAASIFYSPDQILALYFLIHLLEGFGLLLLVINFKFSYFKTAWALVLAGVVQSILAIVQFLTQQVAASKWLGMAAQLPATLGVSVVELGATRWLRAYGSLPHPNILGGFLTVCILLCLVLAILSQNYKEKILLYLIWPFLWAGIFFTFSRSAFLALGIALLFLIIFIWLAKEKNSRQILSRLILIAVITVGILGVIYRTPLLTRASVNERLEIRSETERLSYYGQARNLIEENWLGGVGLGNYTLALYRQDEIKLPGFSYQPVHNVYLLIGAELGVFGILIFILIIIEAIRRIWSFQIDEHIGLMKILKQFRFQGIYEFYRERYYWFLGYTAVFIALLVLMAFDHYFWTLYFGVMLWWLGVGMFVKVIGWIK